MHKVERLVAITLLLQARGKMTAQRLADILGTSTRTIYRDMNALSLAHVPVAMDLGPGGGYYIPEDYHFESVIFTREEAVSLVLSTDIAENNSLFAGDDGLHRALIKLEAALPREYRSDVRAARERILLDTTDWYRWQPDKQQQDGQAIEKAGYATYLEIIRFAVLHTSQLDILYTCQIHKEGRWRRVDPYGLVFKGLSRRHVRAGLWYMVAYCHTCQAIQTFRIRDIENLRQLDEPAMIDPDFDLQSYWHKARMTIDLPEHHITLLLLIAPPARHSLHGDFTILSEQADGHWIIQVDALSEEDAVSYVLALGSGATIISPPEIRAAVSSTAQAIADMYQHF